MANEKNLIPLSTSKAREIGKKGGKASARKKREKKTIQKLLTDLLRNPCSDNPLFEELAEKLGLDSKESVKKLFVVVCSLNTLKKGTLGDLQALCSLIGEETQNNDSEVRIIDDI